MDKQELGVCVRVCVCKKCREMAVKDGLGMVSHNPSTQFIKTQRILTENKTRNTREHL